MKDTRRHHIPAVSKLMGLFPLPGPTEAAVSEEEMAGYSDYPEVLRTKAE